MNNRGYSTGFAWIFAIISLFGLGILYIVFNQVFEAHLVPIIKNQINGSSAVFVVENATVQTIYSGIDKYMNFFHALPFIIFIVIIIYMIVSAIRREREEGLI